MKAILILTGIICTLFCIFVAITNSGAVVFVAGAGTFVSLTVSLFAAARKSSEFDLSQTQISG